MTDPTGGGTPTSEEGSIAPVPAVAPSAGTISALVSGVEQSGSRVDKNGGGQSEEDDSVMECPMRELRIR